MPQRFWLMKCEPAAYAIDRSGSGMVAPVGKGSATTRRATSCVTTCSSRRRRAVLRVERQTVRGDRTRRDRRAGLSRPVRIARKGHDYYDPKHTAEKPVWFMRGDRLRRAVPSRSLPLDHAEGSVQGLAEDDGESERQPAVGAAGHRSRIRNRVPPGETQPGAREDHDIFMMINPATISAAAITLAVVNGSPSTTMPTTNAPTAPMPVQTV